MCGQVREPNTALSCSLHRTIDYRHAMANRGHSALYISCFLPGRAAVRLFQSRHARLNYLNNHVPQETCLVSTSPRLSTFVHGTWVFLGPVSFWADECTPFTILSRFYGVKHVSDCKDPIYPLTIPHSALSSSSPLPLHMRATRSSLHWPHLPRYSAFWKRLTSAGAS